MTIHEKLDYLINNITNGSGPSGDYNFSRLYVFICISGQIMTCLRITSDSLKLYEISGESNSSYDEYIKRSGDILYCNTEHIMANYLVGLVRNTEITFEPNNGITNYSPGDAIANLNNGNVYYCSFLFVV